MIIKDYSCLWNDESALTEGRRRDSMTPEEEYYKKKIIKLLKDDKQGGHHAKYAQRFEKYIFNIVPVGKEPSTAAISFDEGVIYVNRGFLRDPSTFSQLNVLLRHELCHNLMMHQVRMIQKLKNNIPELDLSTSSSLQELLNIIMDFDISNKKYSAKDKETVRNFWINGKAISGLVTEDHRANWQGYSLEKMYDAIQDEIAKYQHTGAVDLTPRGVYANLNKVAKQMHTYKNAINTPVEFNSLEEFEQGILASAKKYDKHAKLHQNYKDIIDGIKKLETDPYVEYTTQDIKSMIEDIANSHATGKFDVVSPKTGEVIVTVYTPEERRMAIECLKIISGNTVYEYDYERWYKEIKRKLGDGSYSEAQIRELRDLLK